MGALEVQGVEALNRALARLLAGQTPAAVERALVQVAEEIMAESKQLVPVDTGTLMNSGHVQAPVRDGDRMSVTLGYGGAAAEYAIPVHELPPDHATHTPPRGWKYLEVPVLAAAQRLGEVVSQSVADAAQDV